MLQETWRGAATTWAEFHNSLDEPEAFHQMTDSMIQAARKLLASGTPPHEVARSLGVSVPTLYRWVPASLRT